MANTSQKFVNSSLDCLKENQFGYLFYNLVAAFCFLFGTPAHLWFLWFHFGAKKKIKQTQVFFLNHNIMELIYCVECGIECLNMFVSKNDTLWYLICLFFGLSWTGRPLLQICICIEQYLAVVHPVTFLRYKGIKYRIAAVGAAWLMAFVYCVHVCKTMVFPDYFYTFIFIIALAVISFCCVSVLYALKHPGPGDKHITKQTKNDRGNQHKRNAFNTIFSALLLILFTYLPQSLLIIFNGVDNFFFKCTIDPLMTSLYVFGVIITPFLKLYKECHKKCLMYQHEMKGTA